jgi:hypothetical protein
MRDVTYFVIVGGILCGAKGGSLLKIRGLRASPVVLRM